MTEFIDQPSPNHDERRSAIDMLVLHYTGMQTGAAAIARLCDPASKVSAHYVVEDDGRIFRLVPEQRRAWHAGVSHWQGQNGVNDVSIGIEIVNPGHEWGYRPFPDLQINALLLLVQEICRRWNIQKTRVIGHADVAPGRKDDPGELFPWQRLADKGLSIAPADPRKIASNPVPDHQACLRMLREIGYALDSNQHTAATLAFQRHFFPPALGRGLDRATRQALVEVHARFTNP